MPTWSNTRPRLPLRACLRREPTGFCRRSRVESEQPGSRLVSTGGGGKLVWAKRSGMTPERCRASADLLGQPNENALGASDVAEPIRVFVPNHFVDELRAMLPEPSQRLVEVVHGEHDTQVAQSVHRGVPVILGHSRREKSRELDPTVAVRHTHHGGLDALVAQSGNAP